MYGRHQKQPTHVQGLSERWFCIVSSTTRPQGHLSGIPEDGAWSRGPLHFDAGIKTPQNLAAPQHHKGEPADNIIS